MSFPAMALETLINSNVIFKFLETQNPILDKNFYFAGGGVRIIRIQRWYTKDHARIIKEFLRPIADAIGAWLIYQIDDVLTYDDIPPYNMARPHFNPQIIGDSVKQIMDRCQLITVTTDQIKAHYVKTMKQDPKKILVIPNYLPRWWIGESFNLDSQLRQYDAQRSKPHIGFACSTNHFDVNKMNNGIDDFTAIMPWIKKNLDKFVFNFVGGLPQQLVEEAQNRKVFVQPPSDIFNYPRQLKLRNLDLLIAPLIDSAFNRCKSNIKWLQFSALGIPMIGQNISTYNKYTDQVFDTIEDIEEWTDKLFFRKDSRDFYANLIIKNRQIVQGNNQQRSYWLEQNLQSYFDLYSLPQSSVKFNF